MLAEDNRLVDSVEVTDEKVYIIHLKSVFDASTVDEFEHVLNYLLSNNHYRFVIDLAQVEFISSAGWGVFVGELQRIRESDGDLKLASMSKEVYEVYLLLELDLFIQAYESVEDGLEDFANNILGVKRPVAPEASLFTDTNDLVDLQDVATSSIDPAAPNNSGHEAARQKEAEETNHVDTASIEHIELADPWLLEETNTALSAPQAQNANSHSVVQQQPPERHQAGQNSVPSPSNNALGVQNQQKLPQSTPQPTGGANAPQVTTARFGEAQEAIEVEASMQPPTQPSPLPQQQNAHAQMLAPQRPVKKPQAEKSGGFFDVSFFSGEDVDADGDDDTNDYAYNQANDFTETANISMSELSGDPVLEKIISVVIAHPSYGPSAIRKMLINLNLINESITRSDIYRKLSEVNLSTRAKRIAFANTHSV